MVLAAMLPTPVAAHVVVASDVLGEWLLWGGLAALFTALYIGIYVWMRRPKFGEGRPSEQPPPGPSPEGDGTRPRPPPRLPPGRPRRSPG